MYVNAKKKIKNLRIIKSEKYSPAFRHKKRFTNVFMNILIARLFELFFYNFYFLIIYRIRNVLFTSGVLFCFQIKIRINKIHFVYRNIFFQIFFSSRSDEIIRTN